MEKLLSSKGKRTQDQPITGMLKIVVENPKIISLSAGLVDQKSLPSQEVAELLEFLQKDEPSGQDALNCCEELASLHVELFPLG